LFDTAYHDVAQTTMQVHAFRTRLRSLFSEGHIFSETRPGVHGETCTFIAIHQAKEFGCIYYGDRTLELWPRGATSGAEHALARLQTVDVVDARLDAEMPARSLQMAFAAFDVRAWHALCILESTGQGRQAETLLATLRARVRRLIIAHPLVSTEEADRVTIDFESTARALRRTHRAALAGPGAKQVFRIPASGRVFFWAACPP